MFGRRRRYARGLGGGGSMGMFLLGLQLVHLFQYLSRSNEYYPVTLAVLGLNVVSFLRPGSGWPSLHEACVSVQGVWFQRQWKRLLQASFYHASDFHLYYNMASFIWKAISLEKHFGSGYFLYMVAVFSMCTNVLYVALSFALAEALDQWSYVRSCAVGFSGVLFALKVVSTHLQPRGMSLVLGLIPVPMKLACWAELALISLLFPNTSFIGHLAGILVGLAFVYGPLEAAMNAPLSLLTDLAPAGRGIEPGHREHGHSYTYRAATTGRRQVVHPQSTRRQAPPPPQPQRYHSYTYTSAVSGHRRSEPLDQNEEVALQEAIQRSLQTEGGGGGGEGIEVDDSPPSYSSDLELQEALERSLHPSDPSSPPPPPPPPPPPYNPAFPPDDTPSHGQSSSHSVGWNQDLQETLGGSSSESRGVCPTGLDLDTEPETVPEAGPGPRAALGSAAGGGMELRQRRGETRSALQTGGHERQGQEEEEGGSSALSVDGIRAARLRRFGGVGMGRASHNSLSRNSLKTKK